jgi:hypothetical protein
MHLECICVVLCAKTAKMHSKNECPDPLFRVNFSSNVVSLGEIPLFRFLAMFSLFCSMRRPCHSQKWKFGLTGYVPEVVPEASFSETGQASGPPSPSPPGPSEKCTKIQHLWINRENALHICNMGSNEKKANMHQTCVHFKLMPRPQFAADSLSVNNKHAVKDNALLGVGGGRC